MALYWQGMGLRLYTGKGWDCGFILARDGAEALYW